MEALVAYESGAWDACLAVTSLSGQSPPAIPEAMLLAVRSMPLVGRGDPGAGPLLERVRPMWPLDGLVGISAGAAEIDWHGERHDVEAVLRTFDHAVDVVGRVWSEHFPARIRLTALVLGHLADAAGRATQAERAGLTDRLPELRLGVDRAEQRVRLRKLPLGPEGVAWLARARAEELRLRWLADAEAPSEHDLIAGWQATVEAFTAMGSPFETARSQVRLVEVLRAVGRPADAGPPPRPPAAPPATSGRAAAGPARPGLADARQRRARAADRPRDRDPRTGGAGPQQRRDRPAAVHQHQDGQRARLQHPGQARRQRTHRGRCHRPARRPAAGLRNPLAAGGDGCQDRGA